MLIINTSQKASAAFRASLSIYGWLPSMGLVTPKISPGADGQSADSDYKFSRREKPVE
jgi:hypothetical protein